MAGGAPDTTDPQTTFDELRQRNVELTAEIAKLTEAVAARDTFLAVAAHELRNAMTPIIGRVQMFRRLVSKPDAQAEKVSESLDQIEWLITQYLKRATALLEVSRITTGNLRLTDVPIEVCQLVRDVGESFRPLAEHAQSELILDLPSAGLSVSGDRLAIEEILDNLLSNAIKYGAGKPIAISARVDEEDGVAVVRVKDSGEGISPRNQARIFERFERAVRPGEHGGGFGVGLWIVRQLSEAMGGTITVTSELGAGSTFCLTLPLQSAKDAA